MKGYIVKLSEEEMVDNEYWQLSEKNEVIFLDINKAKEYMRKRIIELKNEEKTWDEDCNSHPYRMTLFRPYSTIWVSIKKKKIKD